MTEILTITLNPALDLSSAADQVIAGLKLRLDEPLVEPGGGGINVARAARFLGGRVRALTVLGGLTGARIADLLADEGVDLARFDIAGETRQSLAVTDRATGAMYRLQFPGPHWNPDDTALLLDRLNDEARRLSPEGVVVLSGSQPPGLPDTFAQDLARRLAGTRVIMDTSGGPLHQLALRPQADAVPDVLRMDQVESEAIVGHPLPDSADSLSFATHLVAAGAAHCVVLARGAEGSVLVAQGVALQCRPPVVPVVSKIGAGDSFTGAFALAMARGKGWDEALVQGTAAAAAAVITPGSALCRAEDVARLAPLCVLTRMQPAHA